MNQRITHFETEIYFQYDNCRPINPLDSNTSIELNGITIYQQSNHLIHGGCGCDCSNFTFPNLDNVDSIYNFSGKNIFKIKQEAHHDVPRLCIHKTVMHICHVAKNLSVSHLSLHLDRQSLVVSEQVLNISSIIRNEGPDTVNEFNVSFSIPNGIELIEASLISPNQMIISNTSYIHVQNISMSRGEEWKFFIKLNLSNILFPQTLKMEMEIKLLNALDILPGKDIKQTQFIHVLIERIQSPKNEEKVEGYYANQLSDIIQLKTTNLKESNYFMIKIYFYDMNENEEFNILISENISKNGNLIPSSQAIFTRETSDNLLTMTIIIPPNMIQQSQTGSLYLKVLSHRNYISRFIMKYSLKELHFLNSTKPLKIERMEKYHIALIEIPGSDNVREFIVSPVDDGVIPQPLIFINSSILHLWNKKTTESLKFEKFSQIYKTKLYYTTTQYLLVNGDDCSLFCFMNLEIRTFDPRTDDVSPFNRTRILNTIFTGTHPPVMYYKSINVTPYFGQYAIFEITINGALKKPNELSIYFRKNEIPTIEKYDYKKTVSCFSSLIKLHDAIDFNVLTEGLWTIGILFDKEITSMNTSVRLYGKFMGLYFPRDSSQTMYAEHNIGCPQNCGSKFNYFLFSYHLRTLSIFDIYMKMDNQLTSDYDLKFETIEKKPVNLFLLYSSKYGGYGAFSYELDTGIGLLNFTKISNIKPAETLSQMPRTFTLKITEDKNCELSSMNPIIDNYGTIDFYGKMPIPFKENITYYSLEKRETTLLTIKLSEFYSKEETNEMINCKFELAVEGTKFGNVVGFTIFGNSSLKFYPFKKTTYTYSITKYGQTSVFTKYLLDLSFSADDPPFEELIIILQNILDDETIKYHFGGMKSISAEENVVVYEGLYGVQIANASIAGALGLGIILASMMIFHNRNTSKKVPITSMTSEVISFFASCIPLLNPVLKWSSKKRNLIFCIFYLPFIIAGLVLIFVFGIFYTYPTETVFCCKQKQIGSAPFYTIRNFKSPTLVNDLRCFKEEPTLTILYSDKESAKGLKGAEAAAEILCFGSEYVTVYGSATYNAHLAATVGGILCLIGILIAYYGICGDIYLYLINPNPEPVISQFSRDSQNSNVTHESQ